MTFVRTDNRSADEMRPVRITPGFLPNAECSALIEMGNTRVICAASVEDTLPPHLRAQRDEDSRAQVDMNVICRGDGRFIEVQGTAEGSPFTREEMDDLLELGKKGIEQLIRLQRQTIERGEG